MLEVFDEFIAKFERRVERDNASYETLKHWRNTKKKVTGFIKYHFDREDIPFSSLGDTFADDLYDYLTLHVAKPLAEVTARKLISKYQNHPNCIANRKLIPVNSNYRYNVYLKDIAQLCEIRDINGNIRRLDTHDARHFFADMILNNGVPLEEVSKMLGHRSIRTTMRYCRVRKSRISESVAKVRNRLFSRSDLPRSASCTEH